jgi:hypothetical protein
MTDDIHGFLEDARARIAELEDRMRAGWYEDWKAMRQRAEKAEALLLRIAEARRGNGPDSHTLLDSLLNEIHGMWATQRAESDRADEAEARVEELEAERDNWQQITELVKAERDEAQMWQQKAEAEAHHWKLAEGAERDLRLRADQRIRQLEAERC